MEKLKSMLSRKFLVTLLCAGGIVALQAQGVPAWIIESVVKICMAYLGAEGLADVVARGGSLLDAIKKSKAKVE